MVFAVNLVSAVARPALGSVAFTDPDQRLDRYRVDPAVPFPAFPPTAAWASGATRRAVCRSN
jgi:hypothetical protein